MLKKLFKYDFIAIGKTMWLLTLIVGLTTVVGSFAGYFISAVNDKMLNSDVVVFADIALMLLLCTIVIFSYIAVVAYMLLTTLIIAKRYFTNLFTDEGYLTFTLPVKTSEILDAKILSGTLWGAISSVVSFICLVFLVFGIMGENAHYIFDAFSEALVYLKESITVPVYHIVLLVVEYVLTVAINFVFGILLLYFCITLATVIVKKARVLLGVALYITVTGVLSTIMQIVSTVSSVFMQTQAMTNVEDIMSVMLTQFHIQMWIAILIYGTVTVVSYVLNRYLLKNKLNLV